MNSSICNLYIFPAVVLLLTTKVTVHGQSSSHPIQSELLLNLVSSNGGELSQLSSIADLFSETTQFDDWKSVLTSQTIPVRFSIIQDFKPVTSNVKQNIDSKHSLFRITSSSELKPNSPVLGDIIRFRHNGRIAATYIWVADGQFPQLNSDGNSAGANAPRASLMVGSLVNFRLSGISLNSMPPRITKQISKRFVNDENNTLVFKGKGGWLVSPLSSKDLGKGAYASFYLPLKIWVNPGLEYQILRWNGCFTGFTDRQRFELQSNLSAAIKLAAKCEQTLSPAKSGFSENSRIAKIFRGYFQKSINDLDARRFVWERFRSFRSSMILQCFVLTNEKSDESPGEVMHTRNRSRTISVLPTYFDEQKTNAKLSSTFIIHEYIHQIQRRVQLNNPSEAHPSGIRNAFEMTKFADVSIGATTPSGSKLDPPDLNVGWELCRECPYCYQGFAYLLSLEK